MKKIFKLLLCLLVFISFTNIARIFAEGENVSVQDVVNNYMNTNYMQGIMQAAEITGYEGDFHLDLDTTNHKINLIDNDEAGNPETIMTFDYTDEYIAYNGTAPVITEDFDPLEEAGLEYARFMYAQGFFYSVLDTMGYSDKDAELEEEEYGEDFYSQYGYLQTYGEVTLSEEEKESYLKEVRISLNKAKITALINEFGAEREDYVSLFSPLVEKPTIKIAKKNATIVINWSDDPRAYRYILYKSTDNKKWTRVGSFWRDENTDEVTLSYTDKKVEYGKPYYYEVLAIGEYNREFSPVKGMKFVPQPVKNVTTSAVKTNSIKVSWDRQAETGYVIERSTDNKKWKAVKTITNNKTLSYNDTGLKAYTRYYYRVKAYKTVGRKVVYGKYSDVVTVVTAPAKTSFTTAVNTPTSLKLTIKAVKGAAKYQVFRADKKNGTYAKVAEVATPTYVDNDLTYNKTYYYKVRVCSKYNVCGTTSAIVAGTPAFRKPGLTLDASKDYPMTIKVSGIAGVDGFRVYRSTSEKGTYETVGIVEHTTSFMDKTAVKGKTYYYKVKSFIYVGTKREYSASSAVKSAKCLYAAPAEPEFTFADFTGTYTNSTYTLRIYAESEDYAYADFDAGGMGMQFELKFDRGELKTNNPDEDNITISLSSTGVNVDGIDEIGGAYTRSGEYSLEEYFTVVYPEGVLNDTYTGIFTATDGTIYLFRYNEYNALIKGSLGENLKSISIDDEGASGGAYSFTISGNTLTVKRYEEDAVAETKEYERTGSLSREQVLGIFGHYQLK